MAGSLRWIVSARALPSLASPNHMSNQSANEDGIIIRTTRTKSCNCIPTIVADLLSIFVIVFIGALPMLIS
ncbi:hypothetical protein FYJ32_03505 [Bifidobacterium tsurumiense]|nr:hypothetical protein [Bifidobacterium tsurumiense]